MKRGLLFFSVIFFSIPMEVSSLPAATPLTKVTITSGSASERDGVLYVAQDQGLFRKYGLDLTFVQVRNGPVAMSALSSGETQFHWGSVSGANLGAISEGADLVFHRRLYQPPLRNVPRQCSGKSSNGFERQKHRRQ